MRNLLIALALAGVSADAASARTEPAKIEQAKANGVSLSYQVRGPAGGRPILLVAGTEMQLVEWPRELVDGLVKDGFRVVTFDNRDAGGSTHFESSGPPDWPAIFAALSSGKKPPLAYTADDMAADAFGLLDALRIERADVLGVSGGATIAELMAIARPDRVRSLALIAANSGNPAIPMPADPARLASIPQPSPSDDAEAVRKRRLASYRAISGAAEPLDEKLVATLVTAATERDPDPIAFSRQGAAMISLGDIRPRLAGITAPTVVMHGEDDPLISIRSGREVAETIPSASFVPLAGMGHGLPARHVPAILTAVRKNIGRAK